MSVIIGLTGQTGAGKTTISDALRAQGIIVIDADLLAHDVIDNSKSCLGDLVLEFGFEIINHNGELNRKAMAAQVFTDKQKLRRLNQIVYPHIVARIKETISFYKDAGAPLIVLDAPTLYEAGCDRLCDHVVAVLAAEEERCRRIMQRDGMTQEEAQNRIRSQHNDAFYRERADNVLENNGEPEQLVAQMEDLLRQWVPDKEMNR